MKKITMAATGGTPLALVLILAALVGAGANSHAEQVQAQSDDPFGKVDFTQRSIDETRMFENAFRNAVLADKIGLVEAFFRHGFKMPPINIKSGIGDILSDAVYFTHDPKMIRMLLDHGAKPAGDIHDWHSTVNFALKSGNKEIVDLLIAAGAVCDPVWYDAALDQLDDLKKRDAEHPLDPKQINSALDYAVGSGSVETFDWLWAKAKKPDAADNAKRLAGFYSHAAGDGHMPFLLHLEQMGVKPADGGVNALLTAIGRNHVDVAMRLFDEGVKLPPQGPKDFRSPVGETAGGALMSDDRSRMVELLLDHGADINAKDGEGMTPLCWAAYCGKDAICQLLVQRGADVTIPDKYGRTAIWYAAGSNHCSGALELMLKKGAKINWTDSNGWNLLSYAMNFVPPQRGVQGFPGEILTPAELDAYEAREEKTIDLLISAGLDPNGKAGAETPLMTALESNHYPAARALLRHHADVTVKDAGGNTAITYLFTRCHSAFPLDLLEMFLQAGVNPNATEPEQGMTPPVQDTVLQTALECFRYPGRSQLDDQRAAVQMLIKHGAKFSGVKSEADQAMLQAAAQGDQAAMKDALAKGASPDASDGSSYSPLSVSMDLSYFDNATWLLQQGADPKKNAKAVGGQLLVAAVMANRLDMVKLLLAKGVDPHSGSSGLDVVVRNGNKELFDLLLKAGANPNDAEIFTCLQYGQPEMARILLDRGVDPQPPPMMENRANVYWAVYYNQSEILKMLLDHGADPTMIDAYGETPLSEAQQFHKDLVPIIQDAIARRQASAAAGDIPADLKQVAQMAADDFKQGRLDQAAAGYTQMTKTEPSCLFAWSNLGVVRFQQMRYADARDAFLQAVKLKPTDAFATLNLGITYNRLNAHDQALPVLKTAIQLAPTDANAHYFLGLTLAALKQQKDADLEFQKARDLQSKIATTPPAHP